MKILIEKKKKKKKKKLDRCARIAKREYDVWPSAYASGAAVKCRQGKIWKGVKEALSEEDFAPHMMYNPKTGEAKKAETHDDHLRLGKMGYTHAEPKKPVEEKKKKKKKKPDFKKEKKSGLHGWFSRQGGKGKSKGWVDCNTCRKDKKTGRKTCKDCGRKKGEKRAKYPSCRPKPSDCGSSGKGKEWGKRKESIEMKISKSELMEMIEEEITSYLEEKKKKKKGKCTGPTKKASSTSKGKKWMQCVKNPDGKGYKRIHWGQKGVRVTGDSGDTKRKKSFRARHGCKDAKPGTAKYMACKDW